MTVKVTLEGQGDIPALECVALGDRWNSFERPLATFEQVAAWVAAMQANGDTELTGVWVHPEGQKLIVDLAGEDMDVFPLVPLFDLREDRKYQTFDLSGWAWVTVEDAALLAAAE